MVYILARRGIGRARSVRALRALPRPLFPPHGVAPVAPSFSPLARTTLPKMSSPFRGTRGAPPSFWFTSAKPLPRTRSAARAASSQAPRYTGSKHGTFWGAATAPSRRRHRPTSLPSRMWEAVPRCTAQVRTTKRATGSPRTVWFTSAKPTPRVVSAPWRPTSQALPSALGPRLLNTGKRPGPLWDIAAALSPRPRRLPSSPSPTWGDAPMNGFNKPMRKGTGSPPITWCMFARLIQIVDIAARRDTSRLANLAPGVLPGLSQATVRAASGPLAPPASIL
mmetsp:Transcript_3307/g.6344  ORF Transcript_3307/g.6344 Transcript_3307/m.6344 type:complete len:280 (+) Transcript_3307:481-1320(+)